MSSNNKLFDEQIDPNSCKDIFEVSINSLQEIEKTPCKLPRTQFMIANRMPSIPSKRSRNGHLCIQITKEKGSMGENLGTKCTQENLSGGQPAARGLKNRTGLEECDPEEEGCLDENSDLHCKITNYGSNVSTQDSFKFIKSLTHLEVKPTNKASKFSIGKFLPNSLEKGKVICSDSVIERTKQPEFIKILDKPKFPKLAKISSHQGDQESFIEQPADESFLFGPKDLDLDWESKVIRDCSLSSLSSF